VIAGMVPFNVVQSICATNPLEFHRASSGTIQLEAGISGLRNLLDTTGAPVARTIAFRGSCGGSS
jgi:hypothetical protein